MGTYWWSQGDSKEVYLGRFRNSEESELVHVSERQPAGVRTASPWHEFF